MFTRLTQEQVIAAVASRDMDTVKQFKADVDSLEIEVLATLLETTRILEKSHALKEKISKETAFLAIKVFSGKPLSQDELKFRKELEETMCETNKRIEPVEKHYMELNEYLANVRNCKRLLAEI